MEPEPFTASGGGMKALSIRQPWADLILFHGKDIENRTWVPPDHVLGQRIYVHAGKKSDLLDAIDLFDLPVARCPTIHSNRLGAILGEVTVVSWVAHDPSPWFSGPYGWILKDPEPYDDPIPYKGMLGLFTPKIPLGIFFRRGP